jgi:PilZ domain-containing protein
MGQENRRSPRFSFIAVAEITHTDSGEQLDSRVAELSLNGCYVDMPNTIPVGTEIVIKIFAESECFEATAKVIYAHPNLGMGLAFQGVSLKNGELLRQWLKRASMVRNEPNS